jgi:outer membrane protein OmpA-like peptidoglycan-associated protein
MRTGWGYVTAAGVLVVGIALGAWVLTYQIRLVGPHLQQVVVPGEHALALERSGGHTIFHEQRAVVAGRYFASDRQLNGLKLRLRSAGGEEIPIIPPSTHTRYTLADREGSAIATFHAPNAGTYYLSAWYPESAYDTTAVLAIGQGVERRLMTGILGSAGLCLMGALGAAAIATVTFARVRRARQTARGERLIQEVHVKARVFGTIVAVVIGSQAFAASLALAQGTQPAARAPLASVESRWGGVYCDLTELARTGTAELSVRYRYRNASDEWHSMPHVNLVPRTVVFDPVGRTLFGVLSDSSGKPVTSTMLDGQAGRPIPARSSHAHWARFQAPPESVTSVTVLVQGCLPFDDVTIGGSASVKPLAAPPAAIASQEGEGEGIVAEILSLNRTAGGYVSLTFRYRNTGTDQYNVPHAPIVRNTYILDSANKKKYEVARNEKKEPLCSETLQLAYPSGEPIGPGASRVLWAKLGAPPEATKAVSVHLPLAPPFNDVPLSGAASGPEATGSAVAGTTMGVEAALKDLGAKVTEAEIRIDLSADVLFDFDKAEIKKEAEPSLRKVATVLNANPGAKVSIEGHTDGKGADAYNQSLSEQRAASVKQWLVTTAKANATGIATRGWGKTKPVAHNTKPDGSDDPEGRAKNRRVEIVVRKGA